MRVVLADDHNLVRAGIRVLLEQQPGIKVVGEAADGHEALAKCRAEKPDLLLLDIAMPGLNGMDVAERIPRESPCTRVVVLSMYADEAFVRRAIKLGIAGYMLKDAFADELPVLLRAVARGQTYFSPGISRQAVDALRFLAESGGSDCPPGPLTRRQREVLQLVAEGNTSKEIAKRLGLTGKTVEVYRAQIMDRLGIHSIPGLVRYAMRSGLVAPQMLTP